MSTTHPPGPRASTTTRPGLARRTAVVATTGALLVGGAGGFALRWASEPTKAVTHTVTQTVTSPVYSTSLTQSAYVYFDGRRAFYHGPAQVRIGTTITFHMTGAVKDTALAVGDIPDTVTWERAYQDAAAGRFSQNPAYLMNISWKVADLTVTLGAGRHEVVVGTAPAPLGTDTAALAALIEAS